jgi:hypothetical protein
MLFFRSTKKNFIISEQNVVGQICTKILVKNSSQIHQIHVKTASEKIKRNFFLLQFWPAGLS